ncbi:hypothetical protein IQ225_16835 [Synechocystis salina LEGE 06155]|nr:hypothetical protein [Synechocystis salina LEGE 06155]
MREVEGICCQASGDSLPSATKPLCQGARGLTGKVIWSNYLIVANALLGISKVIDEWSAELLCTAKIDFLIKNFDHSFVIDKIFMQI